MASSEIKHVLLFPNGLYLNVLEGVCGDSDEEIRDWVTSVYPDYGDKFEIFTRRTQSIATDSRNGPWDSRPRPGPGPAERFKPQVFTKQRMPPLSRSDIDRLGEDEDQIDKIRRLDNL